MTDLSRRYVADRTAAEWNQRHPVGASVIWFGPPDGTSDDYRETILTAEARVAPGTDTVLVGIAAQADPVPLSSLYGAHELRRQVAARIAREGAA